MSTQVTVTVRLRPHTELPESNGKTAFIAVRCSDTIPNSEGVMILQSMYCWRNGEWRSEDYDEPLRYSHFWWVAEYDLTDPLKKL